MPANTMTYLIHSKRLAASVLVRAKRSFQFRHASGCSEHGHKMPSRRCASHTDFVGIKVVLLGVCPNPTNRRLAIMDLGGPDGFTAESIANRNPGVFAAFNQTGDLAITAPFVAILPTPAMNEGHNRKRLV